MTNEQLIIKLQEDMEMRGFRKKETKYDSLEIYILNNSHQE